MALALSLGRRGQGRVWPNPAVGCVLATQGRVVGRGWTQPGGRPHAEVVALAQAGDQARGGTAYVTLEPCSHHGKTGPCAEALVKAGVARVVVACQDPDPRVSGRGLQRLRDAGIDVTTGVMEAQAAQDHTGFFLRVTQNRPLVTLKLATSLDGRIATASGHSQWITGSDARRAVHAMRARHDAVLIGAGTARQDDPSLTVRGLGVAHQPVRIVASRMLDLPLESTLARSAGAPPVWLCHGAEAPHERQRAWAERGATLIRCAVSGGSLDPDAMLRALADQGLTRIFCEGGGQLAAALIEAQLVDQLVLFQAGLGIGAEGLPALGALGLSKVTQAKRFALVQVQQVGPDVMQVWRRQPCTTA